MCFFTTTMVSKLVLKTYQDIPKVSKATVKHYTLMVSTRHGELRVVADPTWFGAVLRQEGCDPPGLCAAGDGIPKAAPFDGAVWRGGPRLLGSGGRAAWNILGWMKLMGDIGR